MKMNSVTRGQRIQRLQGRMTIFLTYSHLGKFKAGQFLHVSGRQHGALGRSLFRNLTLTPPPTVVVLHGTVPLAFDLNSKKERNANFKVSEKGLKY